MVRRSFGAPDSPFLFLSPSGLVRERAVAPLTYPSKEDKVKNVFKWALFACVMFTLIIAATGCGASGNEAKNENAQTEKTAEDAAQKAEAKAEAEAQAEEEAAADESAGQENARESAESYLEHQSFSRSGLISQLKFEGYSTADATYGVDTVSPDWKEQAAKSAESYLEHQSFSRSGLISQLKFEGYSTAQATYGVNQTGL